MADHYNSKHLEKCLFTDKIDNARAKKSSKKRPNTIEKLCPFCNKITVQNYSVNKGHYVCTIAHENTNI